MRKYHLEKTTWISFIADPKILVQVKSLKFLFWCNSNFILVEEVGMNNAHLVERPSHLDSSLSLPVWTRPAM